METNNQNNIDLIEQFLDGNLSKEEQHNFNVRLETDDEFAELYRFRLKIREDLQKAKQYEKTRGQVSGAIKRVKKQNQRLIIYAVAAGLALLIAIPGVFTLINRTETTVAETDSTDTQLFEPQTSVPKEVASDGKYFPELLKMEVTQTNDSVIFEWEPALTNPAILILLSQSGEKQILKKDLEAETARTALKKEQLPSGKIVWYIEG
ncbi:MAG: hypothetical protein Q7U86_00230, partial [Draconibacterium sp.]|nr:hypothetical protein [Draconibacterium sp.]